MKNTEKIDENLDENLDLDENLEEDLNFLDENLDSSTDDDILVSNESNSNESNSDDEDEDEDEDDEIDIMVKFNTNNHKIEGKHSLYRDTIFKGKVEDNSDQQEYDYNINQQEDFNLNDGLPIEVGSSYEFESKHYEDYIDRLNLQRDIYELLDEKTDLDFSSNRRKPNKQAFNDYYNMLLNNIGNKYSKSEIFVELSFYFTDNIFNMFKLLDKEYATRIIVELKQRGHLANLNNINFI